jgi:error-prone DNA polymerase
MYVELHCHSEFSYLDGACAIDSLVRRAAELGMPALALTDHNSVAGAVKFRDVCAAYGIRPIIGTELTLTDSSHLTLLATNRTGYANVCQLITRAFATGGRLSPTLDPEDIAANTTGIICMTGCRKGRIPLLVRDGCDEQAEQELTRLRDLFGSGSLFIELQDDATPGSLRLAQQLAALADHAGVPVVATGNVHHVMPQQMITHDILTCIRLGATLADIHPERPFNAERYLKSSQQMRDLFAWRPDALRNTLKIAESCGNVLPEHEEITPSANIPTGKSAHEVLTAYARQGVRDRYPTITSKIAARLNHELKVIEELGYSNYLLMAHRIVSWARSSRIRVTGRGSAADSIVAYALHLTDVDVVKRQLPFARFIARGKTPDIDLDIDREKRDDLFRWITREYGTENVAVCCTFHTYHSRGAIRDIGKVLALPPGALAWFSAHMGYSEADRIRDAFTRVPELKPHAALADQFTLLFSLCKSIAYFPRHMGSHSSGVVISREPLASFAPLSPSARGILPIAMFDKDDIEDLGAIKLDLLSLPNHSVLGTAIPYIRESHPDFDEESIPDDDLETYQLLRSGKAMGVFQLQSPAQMALAQTLRPDNFEDLAASIALIRPGPIKTEAVRRFVASRNGWTPIMYLHRALIPILDRTFGCIIYQEQVIHSIAVLMGISDTEADKIRKCLGKHERKGTLEQLREQFVRRSCLVHRDLPPRNAHTLWDEIQGWSGLGFVEGHAVSFAINAYHSAYLSAHHPAEMFAGLMSHQPVGYYAPNSLAAEARRRGVQILPVDINESVGPCTATPETIRLGFCLVCGLSQDDITAILNARAHRPFESLLDFCVRVTLRIDCIEALVLCGAFDELHPHRRGILWRLSETVPLAGHIRAQAQHHHLEFGMLEDTPVAWEVAPFSEFEAMTWSWRISGVTPHCHAITHVREYLHGMEIMTVQEAALQPHGARVTIAGLNIRPHRPGTRSGRPVLFSTIEDETEFLGVVAFDPVIDQVTSVFLLSVAVIVRGTIERRRGGPSLIVEQAKPLHLSASQKTFSPIQVPIKTGPVQRTAVITI